MFLYGSPGYDDHLFRAKLVVYAIALLMKPTAHDNKVRSLVYFKVVQVGVGNHDSRIASEDRMLGLNVTDSTRH